MAPEPVGDANGDKGADGAKTGGAEGAAAAPQASEPVMPISPVSDVGGADDDDDWYEDDDIPLVVTKWRCPACAGNVNLHVEIITDALETEESELSLAAGSAGVSDGENGSAGEDAGAPRSTESDPGPRIGEVGFVPKTLKEKVWLSIEITDTVCHPYDSIAFGVVIVGLLFVVLSVVVFIIETYPRYYGNTPKSFFVLECICIVYFTLELLTRVLVCPSLKQFFRELFTWIDILSVLPFYIALAAGSGEDGLPSIRILRLLRVFRIFKVTKYNQVVHVVVRSLRKSSDGLFMLVFFLMISVVFFSSAVYFVERDNHYYDPVTKRWWTVPPHNEGAQPAPFQSIYHAFWWAMVTLTTVGYGNEIPTSTSGKLVAGLAMLCGTLVIAFPMVIIGQNFQSEYFLHRKQVKRRRRRMKKQRREDRKAAGMSVSSLSEADKDRDDDDDDDDDGGNDNDAPKSHRGLSAAGTPQDGLAPPFPTPGTLAGVLSTPGASGVFPPMQNGGATPKGLKARKQSAAHARSYATCSKLNDLQARLDFLNSLVAEYEGAPDDDRAVS